MACADTKRYAVVEVRDPDRLADAARTLHYGTDLATLEPLDRDNQPFPITLGLASKGDGERPFWIEARDAGGGVLARGRPTDHGVIRFRSGSTASAVVNLAPPCVHDDDCTRDDECVPRGTCVSASCVYAGKVCDDGNDNPNDGCDVCRPTAWTPQVLVGRGEGGGIATAVALYMPRGVASDRSGNLFVADTVHSRVLRWDAATGILAPVAGTGAGGVSGSAGRATNMALSGPQGVAVDGTGNVFVADTGNKRVLRICGAAATCSLGYASTVVSEVLATGLPSLTGPTEIAVDGQDNLFIADPGSFRVLRRCGDPSRCDEGEVTLFAGNGLEGDSGDGGPAVDASFRAPRGVAVDAAGNVYIADASSGRVRRVCGDPAVCTVGTISTVAGNGSSGSTGDGAPATEAALDAPAGVAVTALGDLFITEASGDRIRMVCGGRSGCEAGLITTLAGTGVRGSTGDGGLAIEALLNTPTGVCVTPVGDLIVADAGNNRVRQVCMSGSGCSSGHIATLVGTGFTTASFEGRPSTSVPLSHPSRVVVAPDGSLIVADLHRIVRALVPIAPDVAGSVSELLAFGKTIAGVDGVPSATVWSALFQAVAVDGEGNIFFAASDHRVAMLCLNSATCVLGHVYRVAGTGTPGFAGDGGPALDARLSGVRGLAFDDSGNLFLAENNSGRIRRICRDGVACTVGTIETVAGGGALGDGAPATDAALVSPAAVAVAASGDFYIADSSDHRIRRVCGSGSGCTLGEIDTVAGTGTAADLGDNGPATSAQLNGPAGVALDGEGNLLIVDEFNHRVRKVCVNGAVCTEGLISTVAGMGAPGFSGDGASPLAARFDSPSGLAVAPGGEVFVADARNNVIRRFCLGAMDCTSGRIDTVLGAVLPIGDGPTLTARLDGPRALAEAGHWFVADGASGRVRRLDLGTQVLDTLVGYPGGFGSDGVEATRSRLLLTPTGVAFDRVQAQLFVSEQVGHTIRRIDLSSVVPSVTTFAGKLPTSACCEDPGACLASEIANPSCSADSPGYRDDAVDPLNARFRGPSGLAFHASTRTLFVADSSNHVIRAIAVDTGATSTLAGTAYTRGFFGEGVPAVEALFNAPEALALGNDGSLYVADTGNNRVRRVDLDGVIDTVLGDGASASSGEGGPARVFPVEGPLGLAIDAFGNLFVSSSRTVRVVSAGPDGLATGDDEVLTIYGRPPRDKFPESVTGCLAGISIVDDATLATAGRILVLDACAGYVLQLDRSRR